LKKEKIDQDKLKEFLDETKNLTNKEEEKEEKVSKTSQGLAKPYRCPSCHKSLSSRKEPCKHCGYKGYIPMSDEEIKKTRFVLFIILLIAAVVVYILTR
jgi:uncharacterized paraquat-inducible protein A